MNEITQRKKVATESGGRLAMTEPTATYIDEMVEKAYRRGGISPVSHYQLVYLEWKDIYGVGADWAETSTIKLHPHQCFSVGWVVKEDQDVIVLVPHLSPANSAVDAPEQWCGYMTIPKCSVVHRAVLADVPPGG